MRYILDRRNGEATEEVWKEGRDYRFKEGNLQKRFFFF
jgi:hypothetical protein